MLSTDFEVLTPLSKTHRISRQIADVDTFEATPGTWVELNDKGQVVVATGTAGAVVELCLSRAIPASSDLYNYEANDTKVGRVSTIADPGVRVLVGKGLITGAVATGANLKVVAEGKWEVDVAGTAGVVTATGDLVEIRLK